MTAPTRPSRAIDGKGRTVKELLSRRKYAIDYYQREYKWQTKQVAELLDDLADKFLAYYEPGDERGAVADYGHYFLGSIIVSDREREKAIIDGQQRLTTLTLLLIFLHRHLDDADQKGQLADLIFSQQFGKRSYNLDIPERTGCMDALYKGDDFVDPGTNESVTNILARYADIEQLVPDHLRGAAVPYFTDWLIENVDFVEITAFSDADAYTIFETMNDRGLSLTPADMLKGYLLSNILDLNARINANRIWRDRVQSLAAIGKDEEADAIKSWLRSQHADSIRARERGAKPQDFDLIGTEFHRWIKDHERRVGLRGVADYARFIERDFVFYSRWYERLRRAAESLTAGLECVFFNAQHAFTLQYPVILAPLRMEEDEATSVRKVRVVSAYIDILIHRRIWNWRAIDYSTMQYAMFLVMRDIRDKSVQEVVRLLRDRLDAEQETFSNNDQFSLNGGNGRQIHLLLARLTSFVEVGSGQDQRFTDYIHRSGRKGYEVEHIWANHAERHTDEFQHPNEFRDYRNRVGDLLLLPKSFNASYGDLSYAEKYPHYLEQNLLAKSLNEQVYNHNPGFRHFNEAMALGFEPHVQFRKADLDARQRLYTRLAELIWNPDRLEEAAGA